MAAPSICFCAAAQLRHLLLFAGKLTNDGPLSRKDMQHLRYLNAAAIDCLDRMSAEREKRNEVRLAFSVHRNESWF